MRRAALALAVFLLALVPAPGAVAAERSCGSIGFQPNTDFGAFGIRARDVGCRTARRVARASREHGPTGEPGTVRRYRARRFRCVGRERATNLPSIRFRCTRGEALVTFTRT
ncbi:MAG: hypothetical protein M3389_08995 [Actinomycetota bacterium]|nr:hypothetical protein [Actinomycetota bacterium]